MHADLLEKCIRLVLDGRICILNPNLYIRKLDSLDV